MTELLPLVSENPVLLWVIIGVAVATWATKQLAEASASFREFLKAVSGPLGTAISKRANRRHKHREQEAADLAYLATKVDTLASQLDKVARRVRIQDDYLVYDAEWHSSVRIRLAEQGMKLPPPPHLPFSEWERQHKQDAD